MDVVEIESPKVTMISHAYQVGAPKYPHGVHFEFEMEWVHNQWTTDEDGKSTFIVIDTMKKYSMVLKDEQLETLLNDWKAGCVNYEEWLLDLKHKHEDWKKTQLEPKKSFWQKVFRRTATPSK